jgi:hypothetical protein
MDIENGKQTSQGKHRHAMLFRHRANKALDETAGSAQHAHVSRKNREHRSQIAQFNGEGILSCSISGPDQNKRIGYAVRKIIEYLARLGLSAAFHGHHSVEHIT